MFQDFLHFAWAARVAQANPVARFPIAQKGCAWSWLRVGKLDAQTQAEGGSGQFPGDGKVVRGSRFRGSTVFSRRRGRKTQLAGGSLRAQAGRERETLPGVALKGEHTERFGGREIELRAEPACGVAQEAALERGIERGQARAFESEAFARGAASAANREPGQDQLRCEAGELGLPKSFFIAGEPGHVGKMGAQLRIPGFEQREQLMADAVAGEGEMAVGGVFAPGLAEAEQVGFDLGAGDTEERAKDMAF